MTIKEKKTSKGTPFAIIKFSDLSTVYEIFLFSEILEKNRQTLKEGKSFLITVIKDKQNEKVDQSKETDEKVSLSENKKSEE